jgi:DNA-binding IclR family transcriptional regulator
MDLVVLFCILGHVDATLIKGLRLLEALANSSEPRGVSDLSRELELTRSNVHRTLQTLCSAGYVRTGELKGTYECTFKLLELSGAVMERVDVVRRAAAHMRELADSTQETVHLAAPSGHEVVYLDKIDSPQPVRAYSSIGGRAPVQSVASGKALIAWRSERELRELFKEPLPSYTSQSITDLDELIAETARIRAVGYSINRGEWRESVGGLAAPILNARGVIEAAVGVSGPIDRLRSRSADIYRDDVREAAKRISRDLGCLDYSDSLARLASKVQAANAAGTTVARAAGLN